MANNSIELKAIGDLMNGDYMYIPSYQRGYRWTKAQVEELLSDLLSFAYNHKDDKSFYCLQPVVAKKIISNKILEELNPAEEQNVWEIIDGQQRLTTIYIIFRYLMNKSKISDEELQEDRQRTLYDVRYQTRNDSSTFLKNIDDESVVCDNIDYYHMRSTYTAIDNWIKSEDGGPKIAKRYNQDNAPKKIRDVLFDLLTAKRENQNTLGSVQVVWYELDENANVIEEFRNLNAGKIYLTDAELVKALFLKKQKDTSESEQLERAARWEAIENELHNNDFWYFLNPANFDMPNRIDLIFQLLYKSDSLENIEEDYWDEKLRVCEKELKTKNIIFNKYYELFDILDDSKRNAVWEKSWHSVKQTFEVLKDWSEDAICYNLIGLLCQFDSKQLVKCFVHYKQMPDTATKDDFVQYLEDEIRNKIRDIKCSEENNGTISLEYGYPKVKQILLLLNILQLNKQVNNYKLECSKTRKTVEQDVILSYKFPFSVLSSRKWDVEHIDSFTANNLHERKDQEEWLNTALSDMTSLTAEQIEEIDELRRNDKNKEAIERICKWAEEAEANEDVKNHISNLTLLDSNTNRSYGNALFVTKRKKIIEKMKSGTYVFPTTLFVFAKLFDESGTNRSKWTLDDMGKYENYMFQELKDYLTVEE